jgi:hypothetical protein
MVTSAKLASAQLGSNPCSRCLRKKRDSQSASHISPPEPILHVTGAPHVPVDAVRQSNRKAVIINHVLYPPDSLNNSGTSSTVAISGKSNFEVGGRKLRKKSLLHFEETLKPGKGVSLTLPLDYLNVEAASREATLLRMSILSGSRSPARHVQSGETSTTVQEQRPFARSAKICSALSFHSVVVPEEITTTPGPGVSMVDTEHISTTVVQADSTFQERRARPKKSVRFAENLKSSGEKRERLDTRHVSTTVGQAGPSPRVRVEETQNLRMRFAKNLENRGEECESLERERNDALEKCEALERILDRVYGKCDSLEQELESSTRGWAYLENEVVDLRKQIRNLETEAAAEHVDLDDEIGRGWSRETEIRQLRKEIQRLQAELADESHNRSRTDVDQGFGRSVVTTITQSLQAARHLQFSPKGSPAGSVLANDLLQKEDLGRPLYDIIDVFGAHFGFQNKVETSNQRFHDPHIASKPAAESLIDYSSSDMPPIRVFLQAEQNNPETVSQLPSQQLPELDPDTSSENNDTENDQPHTDILLRFGSPRIQTAPAIHRVRISTKDTDQRDDETCLMPSLNTWEWSSIPDLQLWHPNCGDQRQ